MGLRLAPIIEQFVEQVLDVLRQATLDELTEWLALAPERASRRAPGPPARRPLAERRRRPRRTVTPKPTQRPGPRAPKGEITDPSALLEASARHGRAKAQAAETRRAGRKRPVVSSARRRPQKPAAVPSPAAKMREGETLLRSNGAGVVLRRRRKAVASGEPAAMPPEAHREEAQSDGDATSPEKSQAL